MRFSIFLFTGYLLFHSAFSTEVIQLNGEYGMFETPGFGENYPNNLNITWVIEAPPGYQIEFYFSDFNLEDSYDEDLGGACVYDYVQFENMGRLQNFCGNSYLFPDDAPKSSREFPFRSRDNFTTIRFVSDYSNGELFFGFRGHYVIVDRDECKEMEEMVRTAHEDWDQLVYCNHHCVNIPGSYQCTCRPGFSLHEDQHTCKGNCENQVLNREEGFIASPDYPKLYSRLTDCDWTITVREGLTLDLTFSNPFQIENHFNYTDCVYDYLKVEYSGSERFYCTEQPANGSVIRTNSRTVRVEFHSDNSVEMSGFKMSFNISRQRCPNSFDELVNGNIPTNPKPHYEFEDFILFSCDPGYNLIGERQTTCQSDGTWSSPAPTCQIKSCGYPQFLGDVANSHLNYSDSVTFVFGDVLNLECNTWYEMTFDTSEWRCSEKGEWSPTEKKRKASQIPACTPICGIKNGNDRPLLGLHISGGSVTSPNEWPWLTFIQRGYAPDLADIFDICGGALISPDFVLTAAHCVTDRNQEQVRPNITHVWVGAHNRNDNTAERATNARNVPVRKIIRHPNYDHQRFDNDYALLQLSETIIMNDNVRPICLPNTTADFELFNIGDTSGEVAGWGLFSSRRSPSYELRQVELPTAHSNVCWSRFEERARELNINISSSSIITENMFCAGYRSGGIGSTCSGDSGGPYMVQDTSDRKYFTFGLVSFGLSRMQCGTSVSYSIFASLHPNTTRWIHRTLESESLSL